MPKIVEDDFNESELFGNQPNVSSSVGNPLSAYFRLPGLSVSLPTRGAFFPEGGIELDAAGEVNVLPMRGADEILLQSPDALMNNSAIINLIRSCVPAIKMPELVSAPDLDVLLVAIRVASSGEIMEMDLDCPSCGKPTTFEINLPSVLSTMTSVPSDLPVRLGDEMVVYLRPHALAIQSKILMGAFKETRLAQAIDANTELNDEERSEKLTSIMKNLDGLNRLGLAHSIIKIVIPTGEVREFDFINEFLANTDKKTLSRLRTELERINSLGIDKTIPAVCSHCAHEWEGAIEFNPATFFEERSSD